jgi:hypothetical protein
MVVAKKGTLFGDEGENTNEKGEEEKPRDIWKNMWYDEMLPKELCHVSASSLIMSSDPQSVAAVW